MIHLVTLFAYSRSHPRYLNYVRLLRLWLYQVFTLTHRQNPCRITILTDGEPQDVINPLASLLILLKDMDVEVKKRKAIPNCPFFFGFKLYNLCQINEPFLYLDCDAVPLSNLNHLWTIRKDKPFIGANHQKVKGHTEHVDPGFLNSGVLVVGDPSFLSFEKIFSKVSLQKLPSVPGGDQRILYGFCKAVGYDYQHPQMDTSWNSCSGLTHFVDLSRTEAICKSDGKKVNVNHYWADFKPWQIDCPLFDYFVQSIDHN